jgi:hypothetical protein
VAAVGIRRKEKCKVQRNAGGKFPEEIEESYKRGMAEAEIRRLGKTEATYWRPRELRKQPSRAFA